MTVVSDCDSHLGSNAFDEPSLGPGDADWDYPSGLVALALPCTEATVSVLVHGAPDLAGTGWRSFDRVA